MGIEYGSLNNEKMKGAEGNSSSAPARFDAYTEVKNYYDKVKKDPSARVYSDTYKAVYGEYNKQKSQYYLKSCQDLLDEYNAQVQKFSGDQWKSGDEMIQSIQSAQKIKNKADILMGDISKNKDMFVQAYGQDVYDAVLGGFKDISKSTNNLLNYERDMNGVYKQFDSKEAYDRHVSLSNSSSSEIQKQIDELTAQIDDARKKTGSDVSEAYNTYATEFNDFFPVKSDYDFDAAEKTLTELTSYLNNATKRELAEKYKVDVDSLSYSEMKKELESSARRNEEKYKYLKQYYDSMGESYWADRQAEEFVSGLSDEAKELYKQASEFLRMPHSTGDRHLPYVKRQIMEKTGIGEEELEDNLSLASRYFNAENRKDTQEKIVSMVNEHPVLNSVLLNLPTPVMNLLGGISAAADQTLQTISNQVSGKDTPIDTNTSGQAIYNISNDIRSATRDKIAEIKQPSLPKALGGQKLGVFAYDTLMSGVDSLVSMGAGGLAGLGAGVTGKALNHTVSAIAGVIMGSNAAAGTVQDSLAKGYGNWQSLGRGFASGLAESLTEHIGTEVLLDAVIKGGGAGKAILKSALSEGTEEVANNVLNGAIDWVFNGHEGRVTSLYKKYLSEGYTEKTAMSKAWEDVLGEDAGTFLSAAITGAVFGASGTAANSVYESNTVKQIQNSIDNRIGGVGEANFLRGIQSLMKEADASKTNEDAEAIRTHAVNAINDRITWILDNADSVSKNSVMLRKLGEEKVNADAAKMRRNAENLVSVRDSIQNGTYDASLAEYLVEMKDSSAADTAIEASSKQKRVKKAAETYMRAYNGNVSAAMDALYNTQKALDDSEKSLKAEKNNLSENIKSEDEETAKKASDRISEIDSELQKIQSEKKNASDLMAYTQSAFAKDVKNMLGKNAPNVKMDYTMKKEEDAKYNRSTGQISVNPYAILLAQSQMDTNARSNAARVKVVHEAGHAAAQADASFVPQVYAVYRELRENGLVTDVDVNEADITETYRNAGVLNAYLNTPSVQKQISSLVKSGMSESAARDAMVQAYMQEEYVMNFLEYVEKSGGKVYERLLPEQKNVFVRAMRKIADLFRRIAAKIRGTDTSAAGKLENTAERILSAVREFAGDVGEDTASPEAETVQGGRNTGDALKTDIMDRYSLAHVAPVTPTSDKWQRGHTEEWFVEQGFPLYRDVPEEQAAANEETNQDGRGGKHGTQITGTKTTYEQIFKTIQSEHPDDWQNMRILDASSGLGLGTRVGRNMGFNVTDIEPFPSEKDYMYDKEEDGSVNPRSGELHPDYTDYSLLQKMVKNGEIDGFDYIISNAVLNVIPQDTRDNLVDAMGSLLKPNGQMFVNVISRNYDGALKSKPEIQRNAKGVPTGSVRTSEGDYSTPGNNTGRGHETFVWKSNSVQKVFSYNELVSYLEDALGDGFVVEPYKKIGMTAALVTKKANDKMYSDSVAEDRKIEIDRQIEEDAVAESKSNEEAFADSETAVRYSIRPPYSDGSKSFIEFSENLSPDAKSTFDLFYGFYQKSRITNALSVSGKRVKAVNISSLYLRAQEWNDMLKADEKWRAAAQELADFLPNKVRERMRMNPDGTLIPNPMEEEFKMPSSLAQRLVDSLPYEMIDPTYTLGDKTITLPEGKARQSVGGEAYRRAIISETRKLFREGKLKQVGIGTMSKDRWGSLGFLAENGKTGASGDFTTVCPQMMFNRGCWYCYRRAALEKGVNNKLVANNVWYTGEILRIKDSDIKRLNENGGLRIQSFGDWMPHFSAMLADVLYDAELRGLQVKIITKEPSMINYIAALREQGIGKNLYFNLSADYTIEEASSGTGELDAVNPERPFQRRDSGFWWKRAMTVEEAEKYREKYPWVNTRIVATDLGEFIRGLKDPRVDVVTGYHGNIREFERVDSTTGEHKVIVEALGDAGMPRFAYNPATNEWVTEYEGKTKTHKELAEAIAREGLQMEYYTKTCCITGRCATCKGKCGALARDFNIKNATNRDAESVAYWQKEMQYGIEPEFGDMTQNSDGNASSNMDDYETADGEERLSLASPVKEQSDNIGTFDANNPDIRYSFSSENDTIDKLKARIQEDNEFLRHQIGRTEKTKWKKALTPAAVDRLTAQIRKTWGIVKSEENRLRPMFGIADEYSNGKISYDEAFERMRSMAQEILSGVYDLDDSYMKQNEDFIKYVKSMTFSIPEANESDLSGDGYAAYRRENAKYIKLSRSGTPIDSVYEEICGLFPGVLDPDAANPADQVQEIVEAMRSMEPETVRVYSDVIRDASESLVADVMAKYERGARETYSAYRDRMEKQNVESERKRTAREYGRELNTTVTAYEARIARIEADAARASDEYAKLLDRSRFREQQAILSGTKREYGANIRKNARALRSASVSPKQKKFIPEAYRKSVSNIAEWMLKAASYTGRNPQESMSKYIRSDISHLGELYGEDFSSLAYNLLDEADSAAASADGKNPGMSAVSVLRPIQKLSQMMRTEMAHQNRAYLDGKRVNALDTGAEIVEHLNKRKFAEKEFQNIETDKKGRIKTDSGYGLRSVFRNKFMLNAMSGYDFLQRLGDAGDKLYETLRESQSEQVMHVKEYMDYLSEKLLYDKKNNADGVKLSDYIGDKQKMITVQLSGGRNISMTAAQAMSIVTLYEREAGKSHIEQGGVRLIHPESRKVSSPIALMEEDIRSIRGKLDKNDVRVMNVMNAFIRDNCTAWGNEATMDKYGFKRFTTKDYFPIFVDKNSLPANISAEQARNAVQFNVENVGFAKSAKDNASAPLLVDSFIDVINRHVEGMATYAAYLNSEDTVNRIMSAPGVRDAMQRALGRDSVKFMQEVMSELKGAGSYTSISDSIAEWWKRGSNVYKSAAVSFNTSTAAKQPLSYVRAAAVVSPKYLKRGIHLSTRGGEAHSQMMKYSGIGVKKNMGYSDVGVARNLGAQIGYEKENIRKAIQDFNELGMSGAAKMDEITWDALWIACREEVLEKNPGISLDTEKWMKATAKRFSRVIAQTQVVDSPLDSSRVMRSSNPFVRNIMAFQNEPLKGFNLMMNALDDLINAEKGSYAQKEAGKAFAKSVSVNVIGNVLEAVVSCAFRALRDDDDDFTGAVKANFGAEMLSNTLGLLPGVSQLYDLIYDAVQGYDYNDMGITVLTDIVGGVIDMIRTIENPDKKQETVFKQARDLAESVATFCGVPMRNIDRMLVNAAKAFFHVTNMYTAEYTMQKIFYNPSSALARERHEFASLLVDAYEAGDVRSYEYIYNDMEKRGAKPKSIISSLAKHMGEELTEKDSLVKFQSGSDGWYLGMQAIFNRRIDDPRATEEEITRVYDATNNTALLPKFKDGKYSVTIYDEAGQENKESRSFEGEKYVSYLDEYGSLLYEIANAMRDLPEYRRGSDNEKAWWLTKAEVFASAVSIYHRDEEYNYTYGGKWIAEYAGKRPVEVAKYIVQNLSKES